ncbi:penicillin acylase family protein, partial [Brevirhabdus sp.]|uniref:penicillin acylase family protein n=1 Tax=Brevirhabdus sp. TaxID=2004514 RepID=UPI004059BC7B
HLSLTAPSIWYLARLELRSGGVIGATIPGGPAVLSGRNSSLGWGITSSYADDQDLFIEQLNPDNSQEYRTPDGFKRFETRRSVIRIKGEAPVTATLRWTDNGPVLPGSQYNIGDITPPGSVAALSWTALSDKDTSVGGFLRLMQARSVGQGIAAGADVIAPSQNLVLADTTGIAMQTIGRLPRRNPDHQSQGRLPSPGWVPENRWDGMLPYATNPSFRNPPGGIVGNTNNKMIDRPFPMNVSFDWGDTQRIQRWRKLMQGREVHTRESFIEAQLDTVSTTARSILPLIGRNLWFEDDAAPEGTVERRRQRALKLLAKWNGEMNEHLPEPLIYAAWMRQLQMRLIRDELGSLAQALARPDPLFLERVFRDVDGAAVWCDVAQSTPVEDCTEIAREALDAALLELVESYGETIESWRWGDAHQAQQDHAVLGQIPVLSWFVNIRQSTSGGNNTLRRGAMSERGATPYANVHAAGYRGVYDLADPDSSVFIISTGQSGHPLSRHYDDLGELWRRGEYIPMSLDPELARAAPVGITKLIPR